MLSFILLLMLDPQKNKRWHDGFLKVLDFGNIKLLDENKVELDSDFKQKHGAIQQGDTLEFERYLVEVWVLLISTLIIFKHTNFGGFQDSPTPCRVIIICQLTICVTPCNMSSDRACAGQVDELEEADSADALHGPAQVACPSRDYLQNKGPYDQNSIRSGRNGPIGVSSTPVLVSRRVGLRPASVNPLHPRCASLHIAESKRL